MNIKKIQYALNNYILNPESPSLNYDLAMCYDELEQTASAISHYLRCAERTENKNLQYECMVRAGLAIKKQGMRLHTEKSFFQNAIFILPNRPEAYLFLSETFFNMGRKHDAFTLICIAEYFDKTNKEDVVKNIPYNGLVEIKFKKHLYGKSFGITKIG
jgi:hypothetical protein